MASDEEDSDGEVASSEKEDIVEEGESTDQEVVHQEFSHLEEDFGEYFISQSPFALMVHICFKHSVRLH